MNDNNTTLILNKLDIIQSDVNKLKKDIGDLKVEVADMKEDISGLKIEVVKINSDMEIVKQQVDENTQIINAIYHRKDETDAKLDSLAQDMATSRNEIVYIRQDISELLEDQKSINELLGEHGVSIRTLRRKPV